MKGRAEQTIVGILGRERVRDGKKSKVQLSYDNRKYSEDVDIESQKLLKSGNISDLENYALDLKRLSASRPWGLVPENPLRFKGSKRRVRGLL